MKSLKLGAQLNISFALVLLAPMIVATVFSIVYYSKKIEKEAAQTIRSSLNVADMMYRSAVRDMEHLADAYAKKETIPVLLSLNYGEKLGAELARAARLDAIDMITIVDAGYTVRVRSHAPAWNGDVIPANKFVGAALAGKTLSGTEVLCLEEMNGEVVVGEGKKSEDCKQVLSITGLAPIFDRKRENIIGVMIARRLLNEKSDIAAGIASNLHVNVALFEKTSRIVIGTETGAYGRIIPPSRKILSKVIKENKTLHAADFNAGGSISSFKPIQDFNGRPAGVLMVQTGVDQYLETRRIAVSAMLGIFATGLLLAFIVKQIVERRILNPVIRLREAAEKIGGGDYDQKLEVTSGDEIGELVETFNKMAGDLDEYEKKLKDYNLQLEQRVRERTSELQIANDQLIKVNTILEDTMERMNPGVSKLIWRNQQKLGLVYATELVADVCNYTKLNMILGETMMGEFMTKFFRESHQAIAQYRGMFDKTVGDQIVAIFGTPKDQTPANRNHAFDAIACALKLVEAADRINVIMQASIQDNYTAIVARHRSLSSEDRANARIEDLKFQCRIGINTSNPNSDREIDRMRMVMMGAETCMDYTAQGGSIIYAFRLESSGVPGKIHIGENTKRLVEHVYLLEELQTITLKGLGVQTGYRVIGRQSIFESIFPRTPFFARYSGRVPEALEKAIHTIIIGRIQIMEVRKISEYMDFHIDYLEHLAGLHNLSMARALFGYAVGESMKLKEESLNALVLASIWRNAGLLKETVEETIEMHEPADSCADIADGAHVQAILDDLKADALGTIEAKIVAVCNRFDHMVFDRTYSRERSQEVISPKEVITILKIEGRFDPELLKALEDLMIIETDHGRMDDQTARLEKMVLSGDAETIASAVEKNLTPEQVEELIARLKKSRSA